MRFFLHFWIVVLMMGGGRINVVAADFTLTSPAPRLGRQPRVRARQDSDHFSPSQALGNIPSPSLWLTQGCQGRPCFDQSADLKSLLAAITPPTGPQTGVSSTPDPETISDRTFNKSSEKAPAPPEKSPHSFSLTRNSGTVLSWTPSSKGNSKQSGTVSRSEKQRPPVTDSAATTGIGGQDTLLPSSGETTVTISSSGFGSLLETVSSASATAAMSINTLSVAPIPHAPHPWGAGAVPHTSIVEMSSPTAFVSSVYSGGSDTPTPPTTVDASTTSIPAILTSSTSIQDTMTSDTYQPTTLVASPLSASSIAVSLDSSSVSLAATASMSAPATTLSLTFMSSSTAAVFSSTSTSFVLTGSTFPSMTMSGESGMNVTAPADPKPKSSGPNLAVIIAPVVVILVLLVFVVWAVSYWLMRRRKERKRADSLAKKAQWLDQSFCDGIKAQMMGLDASKVGLSNDHDRGGGGPSGGSGGGAGSGGRQALPRTVTMLAPPRSRASTPSFSPRMSKRLGHIDPLPIPRPRSAYSTHSADSAPTDLDSPEFEISSSEEDSPASTIKVSRLRTANGKAVVDCQPQSGTLTTSSAGAADGGGPGVQDDGHSPLHKSRGSFFHFGTDETGDNHDLNTNDSHAKRVSMVRELSRSLTQVIAEHDSTDQMQE